VKAGAHRPFVIRVPDVLLLKRSWECPRTLRKPAGPVVSA
jgi:hypothetical protein